MEDAPTSHLLVTSCLLPVCTPPAQRSLLLFFIPTRYFRSVHTWPDWFLVHIIMQLPVTSWPLPVHDLQQSPVFYSVHQSAGAVPALLVLPVPHHTQTHKPKQCRAADPWLRQNHTTSSRSVITNKYIRQKWVKWQEKEEPKHLIKTTGEKRLELIWTTTSLSSSVFGGKTWLLTHTRAHTHTNTNAHVALILSLHTQTHARRCATTLAHGCAAPLAPLPQSVLCEGPFFGSLSSMHFLRLSTPEQPSGLVWNLDVDWKVQNGTQNKNCYHQTVALVETDLTGSRKTHNKARC